MNRGLLMPTQAKMGPAGSEEQTFAALAHGDLQSWTWPFILNGGPVLLVSPIFPGL